MVVSVHQPHYLPWLGYFDKIRQSDCFVFLDCAQYKKREYQNRNKIRTADGWMWLTVPVVTKGLRDQPLGSVRIDNTDNWQDTHWKTIQACYGKAPHFSEHAPFLREVYAEKTWELLANLNVTITRYILDGMKIDTPLKLESDIGTTTKATERIIEICSALGADVYLSGTGGRAYLEENRFAEEGIELRYQTFHHPIYSQRNTTDGFLPHMAAIDLLFTGDAHEIRTFGGGAT